MHLTNICLDNKKNCNFFIPIMCLSYYMLFYCTLILITYLNYHYNIMFLIIENDLISRIDHLLIKKFVSLLEIYYFFYKISYCCIFFKFTNYMMKEMYI